MNSTKKNIFYSCLYQFVNICVPLITTPYLSRVLGAEGIGIYSYYFSIAQIFGIFVLLGLNNYGNREIASVRDSNEKLAKTFWSIYLLQLMLGLIVNLTYFSYCFFLSKNLTASILLGLYVISAAFDINWFYFGIEKFKFTSIRNIIIKIINSITIFVFIKDSSDALVYCIIIGVGFVGTQLVLWPYVLNNINFVRISFRDIVKHLKPNLVLFLTVIAVNIYKYMDKIMLGAINDVAEVGYYELSEKVIIIPISFITALGNVMLPRASYLVASGKGNNNELLRKSLMCAMFFSSSISFGMMAVSREFIPIFYGKGYDSCILLFIILLPSSVFLAFANVIRTQYLLPHNMDKYYVISAFIGAIVNFLINTMLIPSYGAIGAAIGTLCAEASVCVYQLFSVRYTIKTRLLIIDTIPFVLSGVAMFLIVFFTRLPFSNSISLVIKILIGIFCYFCALNIILMVFRKNIKELISQLISWKK